jgi:hypothetical protein
LVLTYQMILSNLAMITASKMAINANARARVTLYSNVIPHPLKRPMSGAVRRKHHRVSDRVQNGDWLEFRRVCSLVPVPILPI